MALFELLLRKMIKKLINIVLICSIFILCGAGFVKKRTLSCKEIIAKSLKSIRDVKGLKYHLKVTERGKKGLNNYESSVKFQKKPRQLYLYIKGIELLWLEGKNKGKAYVKPNSFPFINLSLDPMGNLMRQDQHHTLNEMGYDYFADIIEYSIVKIGDDFENAFKLIGEERVNKRPCYKIAIENKNFGYMDYTVGDNESITTIARKYFISEYMILEKNPKFNDYFDILKKGQIIKIPTWYCKSLVIYIDQFYLLPLGLKINDDKGLFEEYNYYFLQVNPIFEADEFTKNYKDYKF